MTWSLCWFRAVGSEATRTEGDSPDFTKMSHINCIPIQRQIIAWHIKVGQKVVFIPWNPRKPLHCAFLANEHQRVGTCGDGREEAPCAASWRGSARGARRPVRAELDSSACTGQTQHEPTEHSPRGIQHRRFVLPLPHTSSPLLGGRYDTSPDTQQAGGHPLLHPPTEPGLPPTCCLSLRQAKQRQQQVGTPFLAIQAPRTVGWPLLPQFSGSRKWVLQQT